MTHGSLFSGIGGFDLAASWMGWENVFHCEINPFGQKILKYYWPDAITYSDITKTDFSIHRGEIDVLTGGFPCQPYSLAGKRKGTEDERHLWPEMLRAIREINPVWIVGENVFGIVNWDGGVVFEHIQADLEAEGYEVQPYVLPACGVNAPHRRDRVWFIAHRTDTRIARRDGEQGNDGRQNNGRDVYQRNGRGNDGDETPQNSLRDGCLQREPDQNGTDIRELRDAGTGNSIGIRGEQVAGIASNTRLFRPQIGQFDTMGTEQLCKEQTVANSDSKRHEECKPSSKPSKTEGVNSEEDFGMPSDWDNFPTQPAIRGRNDGLSTELDGITVSKHRNESIKAYGNAVVPELVFQIFKSIQGYEKHKR